MFETALRPLLEWYPLLVGLLTRAVLEGYLSAGRRGQLAVQWLLLVGLGINEGAGEDQHGGESEEDEDAELSEFLLTSLKQHSRIWLLLTQLSSSTACTAMSSSVRSSTNPSPIIVLTYRLTTSGRS